MLPGFQVSCLLRHQGREEIVKFLTRKWKKENDYKLKKYLWCYEGNRIAVRFEYEFHNEEGQWFRAYGNEVRSTTQAAL